MSRNRSRNISKAPFLSLARAAIGEVQIADDYQHPKLSFFLESCLYFPGLNALDTEVGLNTINTNSHLHYSDKGGQPPVFSCSGGIQVTERKEQVRRSLRKLHRLAYFLRRKAQIRAK